MTFRPIFSWLADSRKRTFILPALGALILLFAGCATTEPPSTQNDILVQRTQAVKLQIFLDANHFGPGVIDGRPGEFTSKALARYNASRSLPVGAQPDLSRIESLRHYTISEDDVRRLGSQAQEPADIEKQKNQPYTSLSELVAERFHTTRNFLARLNPGLNINGLRTGDSVIVPNVDQPFMIEDLPGSKTDTGKTALASRRVTINLRARMLEVREKDGALIAAFPITPGSTDHPAPPGEWRIVGIATFPWFRWDDGVLERGERTETFFNLPPGPNSPVGILWAGLNKPGIGIHGTSNPDTIGRAGSHGCIRLANWDAAVFRTLVSTGSSVTIL
ncbi:MAG TPA: L,D-transpeptidase [Chthoniobacterales bacterium]